MVSWLCTDLIGWLTCHTHVAMEQLNKFLTPAVESCITSSHPVLFHLLKPICMNPLNTHVICLCHINEFFRYHTNGTDMCHILKLFVITLVRCSFQLLLSGVLVFKRTFLHFFLFLDMRCRLHDERSYYELKRTHIIHSHVTDTNKFKISWILSQNYV